MKRLLIISNNVLSNTNNNGKTILSFIEGRDDIEVSQIYLSGELPRIKGYDYYQLSDKDIIRGIFDRSKRGRRVEAITDSAAEDDFTIVKRVGRNDFTLLARDMLWLGKWKSKQLDKWLNEVKPDAVFFVMGDAVFAYPICEYVHRKFGSRLAVYVTDDYVLPRTGETILHKLRRIVIRAKAAKVVSASDVFFTVSEPMRRTYKELFAKDSHVIANMSEDMKDDSYVKKEKELIFTYAGSLYYKRHEVLRELAKAIAENNKKAGKTIARLKIYFNLERDNEFLDSVCIEGSSEYAGNLNKEELKERLNTTDYPVFAESFDKEQIEKTKLSLSTKVYEYMSVGKPILAIGPAEVGSMECLKDAALCVTDIKELPQLVERMVNDPDSFREFGEKARSKYLTEHNKEELQKKFRDLVFGNGE